MKKTGITWLILLTISFLLSCGKLGEAFNRTAKNKFDSIPRYDSLNWMAEKQFREPNHFSKKLKKKKIQQFYDRFWDKNNVSGGLLVAQHGEILFESYNGFADKERETPINADTPIHLASISKVLTSLAILKLVEYHKIALDDTVDKYLIGFPYPDVTIENLLNHRSGLPDYLRFTDDKTYWDKTQLISNQEVLDILIKKQPPAYNKPDKNFLYNNTNFVLLALIIEKVSGLSYPEAMQYMIFNPLEMNNTFVMEFDRDAKIVSKSYYANGQFWDYDHLDKTYGDKNIYSTPRDLLKMDVAMYSDKFLPKELKEKAWKGYSYEKEGTKNYGLGFRLMEWSDDLKILYHTGKWHGNNTIYVRDFKDEVTIVALGNRINRNIYLSNRLVSLFGNYPLEIPDS
ncbi:MAG: serine hydrolase domain-containing protein [Weeksellaceae bacterium]|jgi:CubicO group peptidase (beta-lactamase class C family)|nr:serine hydrolase [Weeksellaceae bacterium]MDX9705519.1 serine hydrolase domain-containing protein [Weeksellaceae bacterium]